MQYVQRRVGINFSWSINEFEGPWLLTFDAGNSECWPSRPQTGRRGALEMKLFCAASSDHALFSFKWATLMTMPMPRVNGPFYSHQPVDGKQKCVLFAENAPRPSGGRAWHVNNAPEERGDRRVNKWRVQTARITRRAKLPTISFLDAALMRPCSTPSFTRDTVEFSAIKSVDTSLSGPLVRA